MQTFLPFPSFTESAQVLDMRRLGKQRVETLQLLSAIQPFSTSSWRNHPAARMWKGYVPALVGYGVAICDEWIRRGYKDTCREKILTFGDGVWYELPRFIGNSEFHAAHRSNLLRKDPKWYGQFGWAESPDLPYVWPI